MTRGRRPLTRAVYSLEEPTLTPPPELVLDTSFVVDALVASQPLHAPCQAFLLRIVEAGTLVVFNRLLETELLEAAYRLALIERFGKDKWKWRRHDGRARRRATRLMNQARTAWADLLQAVDWLVVELDEVHADLPTFMARYGLSSFDAVHAATAAFAGVRSLVTLDAGFAAVPQSQLAIWTNRSRVPDCRRRRARSLHRGTVHTL